MDNASAYFKTKAHVDKDGFCVPPIYPCYQDNSYLCKLRLYPDSVCICAKDIKLHCIYGVKISEEKENATPNN